MPEKKKTEPRTTDFMPTAPVPESVPGAREHATQLLADVQNLTHALMAQNARLVTPPASASVVLTQTNPKVRDDVGEGLEALSFAIYNPNDIVLFVGNDGSDPALGTRGGALSVPRRSMAVFPLFCRDLDIAAAPADLAAGDARVWIFRYETVQAAFLGAA
ncbi:hypothetical protein GKE82_05940 [Conexibacter sp. W3-3-2]|uniref:hypothetical protein n=1 Tax=Conexibacter sp. W3-3-2 TaxID=2675227 RepID=UPI0012B80509|nr:hypothetical protein [Conexibacter sp. W3-3-2]MTD43857.1 hypothetical protein [Conexibacter sp. W3-3-2]